MGIDAYFNPSSQGYPITCPSPSGNCWSHELLVGCLLPGALGNAQVADREAEVLGGTCAATKHTDWL